MYSGECTSIDSLMGSRAGGPGVQGQGSKCGGVETRDRGWRETLGMVWEKKMLMIEFTLPGRAQNRYLCTHNNL